MIEASANEKPLQAEYCAAWVDDRSDRTRSGGVEDASHLAPQVGVERVVIAGATLASGARLLGKSADERDAAVRPRSSALGCAAFALEVAATLLSAE